MKGTQQKAVVLRIDHSDKNSISNPDKTSVEPKVTSKSFSYTINLYITLRNPITPCLTLGQSPQQRAS